jgi:hypothetical protein
MHNVNNNIISQRQASFLSVYMQCDVLAIKKKIKQFIIYSLVRISMKCYSFYPPNWFSYTVNYIFFLYHANYVIGNT